MEEKNRLVSMVNTRGRVMWIHGWEIDNLRKQGCKVIYNPREEYYPQYDLSIEQARPDKDPVFEKPDNSVDSNDMLDVEYI